MSPRNQHVSITWTALPAGPMGDGAWKIVAFVTPHLRGPTELSAQEYLVFHDWPGVVRGLKFWLEFSWSPPTEVKAVGLADTDSDYWTAVFPLDTPVEPYNVADQAKRTNFATYDVRAVAAEIRSLYQQMGKSAPFTPPALLGDPPGVVKALLETEAFAPVEQFYARPHAKPFPLLRRLQFHEVVSALGDHPAALQRLCLAIELRYEGGVEEVGRVRVLVDWDGNEPVQASPWTHYQRSRTDFHPRSRPNLHPVLDRGYLSLNGINDSLDGRHPYDLVVIDQDGAALKLRNLQATLVSLLAQDKAKQTPFNRLDEVTLPALRSGGLGLVLHQRLDAVKARLAAAADWQSKLDQGQADLVELYAEDLLRGYRVDVSDSADPDLTWRSLCKRQGEISFPGTNLDPLDGGGEGYVKSASTAGAGTEDDRGYLHEAIFRWDGWSLVTQRPGLAATSGSERPDRTPNVARPGLAFQPAYDAAQGTLPRLRYGRRYQIAVRGVDLAGNSLAEPTKMPRSMTDEVAFRRYEPLSPPILLPRHLPHSEGESLENLVIRSTLDASAQEYTASALAAGKTYFPSCERHVTPPRGSVALAELHGVLDQWLEQGDEASWLQAFEVAAREQATIGDKDQVWSGEQLTAAYLPDPAVAGATLWQLLDTEDVPESWKWSESYLSASPELVQIHTNDGVRIFSVPRSCREKPDGSTVAWPDVAPFRLALREAQPGDRPGTFQWDEKGRVLMVRLAKAQVLKLRYSSLPSTDVLSGNILGIWAWLLEAAYGNPIIRSEQYIGNGLLWLLTPYRTLTLVHAIEKPRAPRFGNDPELIVTKEALGETKARIMGMVRQDVASTAKMEFLAEWVDSIDDLAQDQPQSITRQQQILAYPVPPQDPDAFTLGGARAPNHSGLQEVWHEFGDTRYHSVGYTLRATTRFREYFPPLPENLSAEEQRALEIERFTDHCSASTQDVLNSARPLPPHLAYVVPTFSWVETLNPKGFVRTRVGGGLRIYLERPWFSSGNGERLAVILWPAGSPEPADQGTLERLSHLVSSYGQDPLRLQSDVASQLTHADFFAPTGDRGQAQPAPAFSEPVSLAELDPDQTPLVTGISFEPKYSREQERWYVDLQIGGGKLDVYYPFARLALARYQPKSIPNAHLSPVVLTDFIQLVPTRILTFSRDTATHTGKIVVQGVRPATIPQKEMVSTRMEVSAEVFGRTRYAADDPLGWSPYKGPDLNVHTKAPAPGPEHFVWTATFSLPQMAASDVRLLVKEWEDFPGHAYPDDPQRSRLVYADEVRIG
jgi:hypothetical protein